VIGKHSSAERAASLADAAQCGAKPPHSQALSRLFEEHNRALHSFLMIRVGNDAEAREVAQEAYVRMLQLDKPGAVSYLRAYLFKTAANIAVDRARQRITRARLEQGEAAGVESVDRLSPDRCLMAHQDLALVEQALFELPPRYRRAFVLHRVEDWSTGQIAWELGVNKRMVRNYISRAAIYCQLRLKGLPPSEAKAHVTP
jgi:RNA polymerase sigma-70 factor (ECF subfamily)